MAGSERVFESAVTLLGGGDFNERDLQTAMTWAPALVCADGAANILPELGLTPRLIVGDLDSISLTVRHRFRDRLHRIPDQDITDFDKCLSVIVAPMIICVGFSGGRLDHELSTLSSLAAFRGRPVIMLARTQVCFRLPERLRLPLAVGTTVSVFPFTPSQARSRGLQWPLDGLVLSPSGLRGTSNRSISEVVDVEAERGDMLMILPRSELESVLCALLPEVVRVVSHAEELAGNGDESGDYDL